MADSCSLTCNVKDKDNRVKVSALWEDLTKFFEKDRREAVIHYFLTKDPRFVSENRDTLKFDIDGEVTIESLKKAMDKDGEYSSLSNALIIKKLNKDIQKELKGKSPSGTVAYSEALDNVLLFNKSNKFRDGLMATMKREDDGKYSVSIIERNPTSEYELADIVQNQIVTEAIKTVLRDRGLSIEFLENPSFAVQYSTEHLAKDADDLYTIASILNGNGSSVEAAEAAGHLIAAAMVDTPLVQRLMNALTPEVQQAIFKGKNAEYYREDFIVTEDSAKEAAGILIGKALLQPFREAQKTREAFGGSLSKSVASGLMSLLKRIGNAVRNLFGNVQPKEVRKLVEEAKVAASTAAKGFITDPTMADVSQALSAEETYTSDYSTKYLSDAVQRNVDAFKESMSGLRTIIAQLKTSINRTTDPTNKDIYKELKELSSTIYEKYGSGLNLQAFANNNAISGMISLLEGVTNVLDTDVRSLLAEIQPSDRAGSYSNIGQNAHNMRTVNTTVKGALQIYRVLSNKLDSMDVKHSQSYSNSQDTIVETLRQAVDRLGDVLVGKEESFEDAKGESRTVHGLSELLEQKRRVLFVDAFRDFYGNDFVEHNAGMVWQNHKLVHINREKRVDDCIMALEEDISWFDRYLGSAADCGDFVTAVGYRVIREANMNADRISSRFWDRIETLRIQMSDAFGNDDTTVLFEVIEDKEKGTRRKTGNFVTEVNNGAWEEERRKFKEQLAKDYQAYLSDYRKEFYKNNPRNVPFRLTDEQEAILYHEFADERWKQFHAEHSKQEEGLGGKRWVPDPEKYHNKQWDDLFGTDDPSLTEEEKAQRIKRLKWYKAFVELKRDMDNMLPKNATVSWRAPQFTGRFGHRFRNLKEQKGDDLEAFGGALRRECGDLFRVRQDESWMFGSNNEFNTIDEDPLHNPVFFEKEKIDRLPIFGVNKLHNMEDLSTDVFGTLMQYGSMAATYYCMESVVDIFELGKDVLKGAKVGDKVENGRSGESRRYGRYLKFVESDVYGVGVTPPSFDRKGVWRKLSSALSSLGAKVLLGGNVHGGLVNLGTGMFEILKEAMAEENFNNRDLSKALQMYYDGLLSSDGYFGTLGNMVKASQRPVDKNSLWIRHWNIRSMNKDFYRNQRYDVQMNLLDNRLGDWVNHIIMLPYSSGDHFMQTIPYYAMGYHEKVYDENGNMMDLIDAYEIVDGEEVHAIDALDGSAVLGKTPKKLKLKDKIFRSVEDIETYHTVLRMFNKLSDYFDSHPDVKMHDPVEPFFSEKETPEESEYLADNGFKNPTTVKELASLKRALAGKLKDLVFNSSDESAFMDKCRNICNRLHGIYNTEDKVAFQQHFYGNLALAMRGYALGMINRRFAGNRFNVPQKKNVEGSYNTYTKVLLSSIFNSTNMYNWKALGESLLLSVPGFNAYALYSKQFGDRLKADMQKAGFSEHQYYNMRRTSADFLVLEALALMNFLASPGRHFGLEDDEDEDGNNKIDSSENWLAGFIYYFTMRWFNEQGAFTWLPNMWTEGYQLLDWMPAGASGCWNLVNAVWLIGRMWADNIGEPDLGNADLYYQSSKEGKYEEGDSKGWIKFQKMLPYWRSYYAMRHPYDTATSYEYGRKIRGY